jgi:hypothetical protein
MKKYIILSVLFVIIPLLFAQERVTITTYYPAPYGVYETLRLYPNNEIDVSQPCDKKGEFFMRNSDSSIYVCDGVNWKNISKPKLECITGIYRGGKNGYITKDMFKPLYSAKSDRNKLWLDLITNMYIDNAGFILGAFYELTQTGGGGAAAMELDSYFEANRDAIYNILATHINANTPGSGIVSPTSHSTPLVGSSTLEDTSYNFEDVFTVADVYENKEAGWGRAPIIRCRAENGWIATGCASHTWGQGGDEDEYMLHNGCKGQQYGDNRVAVRCCRVVGTDKDSFTFFGDEFTGTSGKNIIY